MILSIDHLPLKLCSFFILIWVFLLLFGLCDFNTLYIIYNCMLLTTKKHNTRWGYTTVDYPNRLGPQMAAVNNMLHAIIGHDEL